MRGVAQVPSGTLRCGSDEASAHVHGVYVLCALAALGLGALLLCLLGASRRPLRRCAQLLSARAPAGANLRVTLDGYHVLGREPEAQAELV